jgi:hypothetical protein
MLRPPQKPDAPDITDICGSKSSSQSKMGKISITNGIAIEMRNLCLKILVMAQSLRYAEKVFKINKHLRIL